MTDANGQSPIQSYNKITYTLGEHYEILDANTDENEQCAAGINVATLDWCLHEYKPGWRIFVVEFTTDDIACIPTNTDGKFRLFRCWVCAELDVDALLSKPEPEKEEGETLIGSVPAVITFNPGPEPCPSCGTRLDDHDWNKGKCNHCGGELLVEDEEDNNA